MIFQIVKPVCAAAWTGQCVGTGMAGDVATITGITCVIANLLTQIPRALTFAAVIMVIWAGLRLIGAGAEPKAYAAAWSTLTYAIIGLILMAVIWLVMVLIQNFTGAKVTEFGF